MKEETNRIRNTKVTLDFIVLIKWLSTNSSASELHGKMVDQAVFGEQYSCIHEIGGVQLATMVEGCHKGFAQKRMSELGWFNLSEPFDRLNDLPLWRASVLPISIFEYRISRLTEEAMSCSSFFVWREWIAKWEWDRGLLAPWNTITCRWPLISSLNDQMIAGCAMATSYLAPLEIFVQRTLFISHYLSSLWSLRAHMGRRDCARKVIILCRLDSVIVIEQWRRGWKSQTARMVERVREMMRVASQKWAWSTWECWGNIRIFSKRWSTDCRGEYKNEGRNYEASSIPLLFCY